MTIENTNPAPTTEPVAPAGTAGISPAADGAAQANAEAERIRRKFEAMERKLADAEKRAQELVDAKKTEAELEREKAIADARKSVAAEYEAKMRKASIESAALLHLGQHLSADAARALAPSVLASSDDLTVEDIPAAVEALISKLGVTKGPGGQGGFPTGGASNGPNPFDPKAPNFTEQAKLIRSDPAKAKQLAGSVGVKISGLS